MKISYLFQISENNFFVVPHDARNAGIVEGFQVTFDDQLEIPSEFFLRLDQLFHDGPKSETSVIPMHL